PYTTRFRSEPEGNPGEMASGPGEIGDADGCDGDRCPLNWIEPFAQHDDAEHHVDERIDEVAEARFDDPLADDAVNLDRPVRPDERCARKQPPTYVRVAERRTHLRKSAAQRKPGERKQATPYEPLRGYL